MRIPAGSRWRWMGAVWITVALAGPSDAPARSIVVSDTARCPEALAELCKCLNEGNLPERRAAVRAALFADTPEARHRAVSLFSALSYEVDLRPYADAFREYCATTKGACFWNPQTEYWSRLRFDPLPVRVEALERIIQSGRSGYPGGELPRYFAVLTAAREGLGELAPLITEYLATLTPKARKRFGLESVPALLELTRGAEDEQDAAAVAGARLAAFEDEELFCRMEEDAGFREAAVEEARKACKAPILTGKVPEACADYADVVFRQKRRFPDAFFSSGCIVDGTIPRWLDFLHGAAGSAQRPEAPAETAPPERPERSARLDACSVPDLPGSEHWPYTPFWGGRYYTLLREGGDEVGIVDGLGGHRPGEIVRLRVDMRGRGGDRPAYPVAIRVSLPDAGAGSLSLPGKRQSCTSIRFFWNRLASHETSLVDTQEFDYTVGRAELAGLLPDENLAGKTVPLWKATATIRIDFAQVKDGGEMLSYEGGAMYDVRPVGELPPAGRPDPLATLAGNRKVKPGQLMWLGPDLEVDYDGVLHKPFRQYLAMVDPSERADSKRFQCRAQLQEQPGQMPTADVELRRLANTPIFVAPVTVAGNGTPMPGTEIGRSLRPPIVLLECCGPSDFVCEPQEAATAP